MNKSIQGTMRAIITTKYGSPNVLQLQYVQKPKPKSNEILVKIKAASVTRADTMMRKGTPWLGRLFIGLTKPKYPISGTGFSGVVKAVGKDVTKFEVGNAVFGESTFGAGTNAEYLCIAESGILTHKPKKLLHEEAATICDGPLTSYNFLKEMAGVQPGQSVLINGASGSLGTAAVQLAKHLGAEVTGVCSTQNIGMVISLGADKVIDYTKMDFTTIGDTYDVIFDTVGKRSYSSCKAALKPKGIYLSPVLSLSLLFQVVWTSMFGRKKAKFSATGTKPIASLLELITELMALVESGQLKAIIDKIYSLEEIKKAHEYVDTGRKRGNVIISLQS
ncbi:NAD(P)-dependent alcohol dehydrogenase [Zobellia amurskyensis]|nr:NAD(P)-dependent alcohol dehydrogenase [Zobellia amurskyensis]